MLKYAILLIIVAMAGTIYIAQRQAAKPPVEQTIGEGSAPTGNADLGQVAAKAGKVIETMNAGGYTYVHVDTGREKIWAAGPETVVKVGDNVSFVAGMEMHDFTSQTLDRTFKSIQFVPAINAGENAALTPEGHPPITKSSPNAGDTAAAVAKVSSMSPDTSS